MARDRDLVLRHCSRIPSQRGGLAVKYIYAGGAVHFDRDYARGYLAGLAAWEVNPVRAESSEPAWNSHLADKARRAALKNATPSRTDLRV